MILRLFYGVFRACVNRPGRFSSPKNGLGPRLEHLVRAQRFYVVRGEPPDNFRGVASGWPLFRGKNVRESAVETRKLSAVRSLEVVASRR